MVVSWMVEDSIFYQALQYQKTWLVVLFSNEDRTHDNIIASYVDFKKGICARSKENSSKIGI